MTIAAESRLQVRQRSRFACEFCGVTEMDSGGELTIDHYHPLSRGGTDHIDNLVYCCVRCNQYKAAYWPKTPSDPILWNPRQEQRETHFVTLVDGTLHPITETGSFSLKQLRLNRPPLISYRKRKHVEAEQKRLLARYRTATALLTLLHQQQATLLEEQHDLLEEQRTLIAILLKRPE